MNDHTIEQIPGQTTIYDAIAEAEKETAKQIKQPQRKTKTDREASEMRPPPSR